MDHMIYLECAASGCAAEVALNDIPLAQLRPGGLERMVRPVHDFIRAGRNTIRVLVAPGERPGLAAEPRGHGRLEGASASARLVRYPVGAFTGTDAGEVLAECAWRDPGREVALPPVAEAAAEIDIGLGRWAWEDAEVLDAGAVADPALLDLVARLHGALAAGQPEPIAQALALHYEEASRAYPVRSAARLAAEFVEGVRRLAAEPGWWVPPFDPARTDFRLCADGRLVEILDRDWQPTLHTAPIPAIGNQPYGIALFAGRIGGVWRILR